MKKIELLSPAGNMETLLSAINNGADAIYIGGENFSARAFAQNFDKEKLKEAVYYTHLYGVKLYVAVNTVIFEKEIEECINYLKYLYEIGVDAVIMQDIGMISLCKKLIPNLEIHSSTQANCHNDECLKFLKNIGVKRAVLAREMTIDEIKNIKTDIDIEIFIHGALCVSYSGRCLFSSLNGGRSGNRGRCVGSCRLPYEIYQEGKKLDIKYPLSTKELCTVENIDKILSLNITSLKIEGRMKSPEYVGYVTKVYRRLIDEYYEGKIPKVKKEELINLAKLYNRKFTKGYLFNNDIYNTSSSNHIGYHLGKTTKITDKKIYIKLDDNLYMEDGIRFINENKGMIVNKIYNTKGLLVNHIDKGQIAVIDNKINIKKNTEINKTIDIQLLKEIRKTPNKKIGISFNLKGYINKPLTLTISDGTNTITKKSVTLEKAKNRPTSKIEIEEKLNKIGNTPFKIENINIDIENVFIPLKILNELRHNLIDKLIEKRTKANNKVSFNYKKEKMISNNHKISIEVKTEKQLLNIKDKVDRIYTEDYNLYKKYKDLNIYYRLPSIIKDFKKYKNEKLLINELGSLNKYYKDNEIITDYTLNITNSESVKLLNKYNVKAVTLSPEVPNNEILNYSKNIEKIIYGKLELMILKDFYLKGENILLKNKFGKIYPIINNQYTKILHSDNIDKTDEKIKTDVRIILYDEDNNKVNTLLNKIKNEI
ncbi:MAG: U32 family peptidase [Bacilli bacterium]|nr:U32 family peptidase [Bacilli bacterium]